MWLFTTFGFFSVVEKPADKKTGHLTIRARARADLEALKTVLPELGEITAKAGTDYPYRARVLREPLALAMADLVRHLDYDNFKNAVAKRQGHGRAHTYGTVWSALLDLEHDQKGQLSSPTRKLPSARVAELRDKPDPHIHPKRNDSGKVVRIEHPTTPTASQTWATNVGVARFVPGGEAPKSLNMVGMKLWEDVPHTQEAWNAIEGQNPVLDAHAKFEAAPGKKVGAGVVIREQDGRVWLTMPTNRFGNYEYTFPKGTVEEGLGFQASAIKETFEETGLRVELVGFLGDFDRSTTRARYYVGRRIGGTPTDMGWESQGVCLAPIVTARKLLTSDVDRMILDAMSEIAIRSQ